MVYDYGLQEVWMPEQEVEGPKANIFMSPDFRKDFAGQRNESALILI